MTFEVGMVAEMIGSLAKESGVAVLESMPHRYSAQVKISVKMIGLPPPSLALL